jgi:Zn-finger nucleic acid-binding protein
MMYREGRKFAGACPRCQEPLLAHPESKSVRTCGKCGGVMADLEASRRIVSTLDRALLAIGFEARMGKGEPPKDRGGPVACPECLVEMQKARIESAMCDVDACPAHGTWFDAGELEAVMRAYASFRRRGVRAQHERPPEPAGRGSIDSSPAPAPQTALDVVSVLLDSLNK